jgi:hypothetical protein
MIRVGAARRVLIAAALVGGLFLAGCGQKSGEGATEGEKNIKALASLMMRYMQTHRGSLPPNEAEFKKFVDGLKPEDLTQMNVDKSKVFTSPRDNQPYVIVYGGGGAAVPGGKRPPNEKEGAKSGMAMSGGIIAYEKTGSGGKRYIVRQAGGSVSEVPEDEFKRLVPNAQ